MSQGRLVAIALIIVGVILALVSIFAHQLGLGPNPGFGWKKLLGTVVGIIILIAGIILLRQGGEEYEDEDEGELVAEDEATDSKPQA